MNFYTSDNTTYFTNIKVSTYQFVANVSGAFMFLNGQQMSGTVSVNSGDRFFFISSDMNTCSIMLDGVPQEFIIINLISSLDIQTYKLVLTDFFTIATVDSTIYSGVIDNNSIYTGKYINPTYIDDILIQFEQYSSYIINSLNSYIDYSVTNNNSTTLSANWLSDLFKSLNIIVFVAPTDLIDTITVSPSSISVNIDYYPDMLKLESYISEFITDAQLVNIATDFYNIVWTDRANTNYVPVSIMNQSDVVFLQNLLNNLGIIVKPNSDASEPSYVKKIDMLVFTNESVITAASALLKRLTDRIEYSRSIIIDDLSIDSSGQNLVSVLSIAPTDYNVSVLVDIIKLDNPSYIDIVSSAFEDMLAKSSLIDNLSTSDAAILSFSNINQTSTPIAISNISQELISSVLQNLPKDVSNISDVNSSSITESGSVNQLASNLVSDLSTSDTTQPATVYNQLDSSTQSSISSNNTIDANNTTDISKNSFTDLQIRPESSGLSNIDSITPTELTGIIFIPKKTEELSLSILMQSVEKLIAEETIKNEILLGSVVENLSAAEILVNDNTTTNSVIAEPLQQEINVQEQNLAQVNTLIAKLVEEGITPQIIPQEFLTIEEYINTLISKAGLDSKFLLSLDVTKPLEEVYIALIGALGSLPETFVSSEPLIGSILASVYTTDINGVPLGEYFIKNNLIQDLTVSEFLRNLLQTVTTYEEFTTGIVQQLEAISTELNSTNPQITISDINFINSILSNDIISTAVSNIVNSNTIENIGISNLITLVTKLEQNTDLMSHYKDFIITYFSEIIQTINAVSDIQQIFSPIILNVDNGAIIETLFQERLIDIFNIAISSTILTLETAGNDVSAIKEILSSIANEELSIVASTLMILSEALVVVSSVPSPSVDIQSVINQVSAQMLNVVLTNNIATVDLINRTNLIRLVESVSTLSIPLNAALPSAILNYVLTSISIENKIDIQSIISNISQSELSMIGLNGNASGEAILLALLSMNLVTESIANNAQIRYYFNEVFSIDVSLASLISTLLNDTSLTNRSVSVTPIDVSSILSYLTSEQIAVANRNLISAIIEMISTIQTVNSVSVDIIESIISSTLVTDLLGSIANIGTAVENDLAIASIVLSNIENNALINSPILIQTTIQTLLTPLVTKSISEAIALSPQVINPALVAIATLLGETVSGTNPLTEELKTAVENVSLLIPVALMPQATSIELSSANSSLLQTESMPLDLEHLALNIEAPVILNPDLRQFTTTVNISLLSISHAIANIPLILQYIIKNIQQTLPATIAPRNNLTVPLIKLTVSNVTNSPALTLAAAINSVSTKLSTVGTSIQTMTLYLPAIDLMNIALTNTVQQTQQSFANGGQISSSLDPMAFTSSGQNSSGQLAPSFIAQLINTSSTDPVSIALSNITNNIQLAASIVSAISKTSSIVNSTVALANAVLSSVMLSSVSTLSTVDTNNKLLMQSITKTIATALVNTLASSLSTEAIALKIESITNVIQSLQVDLLTQQNTVNLSPIGILSTTPVLGSAATQPLSVSSMVSELKSVILSTTSILGSVTNPSLSVSSILSEIQSAIATTSNSTDSSNSFVSNAIASVLQQVASNITQINKVIGSVPLSVTQPTSNIEQTPISLTELSQNLAQAGTDITSIIKSLGSIDQTLLSSNTTTDLVTSIISAVKQSIQTSDPLSSLSASNITALLPQDIAAAIANLSLAKTTLLANTTVQDISAPSITQSSNQTVQQLEVLLQSLNKLFAYQQLSLLNSIANLQLTPIISFGTRPAPTPSDEYDIIFISWVDKSRIMKYGDQWTKYKYATFSVEYYFIDRLRELYMFITPGNDYDTEMKYLANIIKLYGNYIKQAIF